MIQRNMHGGGYPGIGCGRFKHYMPVSQEIESLGNIVAATTLLKKKARGVLGLRGVTAQGVLWQHTRVLS